MLLKNRKSDDVYLEQAGADGAAAGGAGGAAGQGQAAGAGTAGAGAAGGQAVEGGAGASSALASGGGQGSAGGETTAINELIPEKYRVSKEDGTFDLEASVRKLAPGYSELAKKLGAGEAAPETPEAYEPKVEVEGFNWDEVKADPKMQSFLKKMHGKGINNAQLSDILTEYYGAAGDLIGGAKVLTQEECKAQLMTDTWKTDAEYQAGIKAANRAFSAFAEKAGITMEQVEEAGLADNPLFLRLLASIAPELGEDSVPNTQGTGGGSSNIEELMNSEAYWNPSHKDYESTRAKVKAHFEKQYPGAAGLR